MRLIDGDELIDYLEEILQWLTNIINSTKDEDVKVLAIREKSMWMEVMRGVQNAPTIEAEPVKHGRWIVDCCYNTCSVCKKPVHAWNDDGDLQEFEYCPNCGSHMDLEDNE